MSREKITAFFIEYSCHHCQKIVLVRDFLAMPFGVQSPMDPKESLDAACLVLPCHCACDGLMDKTGLLKMESTLPRISPLRKRATEFLERGLK